MSKNKKAYYSGSGDEPTWDHLTTLLSEDPKVSLHYIKANNWYHHQSDEADHKKWIVEWMVKNKYPTANINSVKKLGDVKIRPDAVEGLPLGMSVGHVARMINLGAPLVSAQVANLKKCVAYLITKGKATRQQATVIPKVGVREHVREQVCELIEKLEVMVDSILQEEKFEWSPEEFIKTHQIKPMLSAFIADWFTRQLDEVNIMLSGEADDQLKEGYSMFKKVTIRRYQEWLQSVVTAFRGVKKVKTFTVRKPKRRTSPIDRVTKMKWKKSDTELGIESVHPSRIVGASKVVLFDTKKRDIVLLEADSVDGLDVQGTTIKGFGVDSKSKKVRKPKVFLQTIKGEVGIRAFKTAFDGLKTEEKSAIGRTNSEMVILTVYK